MNIGEVWFPFDSGDEDMDAAARERDIMERERAMLEVSKRLATLREAFVTLADRLEMECEEHEAFCDEVAIELAVWELMCRKLLARGGAKGREVDDELEALYDECRKEVERGKKDKDANDDV